MEQGFVVVPLRGKHGEGVVCCIDASDSYPLEFNWFCDKGYAARYKKIEPKVYKYVLMHREILGDTPENMEVDYIDGDRANNRRSIYE